jgi:hypothetical protein
MTQSLPAKNRCPRCGNNNRCALSNDPAATECWCFAKPIAAPMPQDDNASCYCVDCLRKLAAARGDLQKR